MSKIDKNFKTLFGKFWFFQFFIIGVLILYGSIASVSLFVLANNNQVVSTQNSNTVVVTLIFESKDQQKPITWNSIVKEVKTNSTLYTVMNATLNLTVESFSGNLGYLITGINSINSYSVNSWTYYYFAKGIGWVYSSVGVSNFILNHDYQIKWIFGPGS